MASSPLSIRFPVELAERVRRRATRNAETTSGLVSRLVDEGIRMAEHPGIMFRDGPTGRRAGLVAGPDVWEVVATLKMFGDDGSPKTIKRAAKWLGLDERRIRTAEAYYAAFPEEIDERIAANEAAAEHAMARAKVHETL